MKKTASYDFDAKMLKNKWKVWCLMAPAVVQDFAEILEYLKVHIRLNSLYSMKYSFSLLLLYCYLCYKHSPLYLHCQLDNVTSSLEAQYAQYAIWLFWRPICHYTKVVNTLRWCIIPGGSLRGKWNWNVWYLTEILLDPPLGPLMQRLHPQMTSPFDISIFSKGNCSLKPFPPLQPPVLKSSSQTQNLLLTQTVRKRHPQTYHNDHRRSNANAYS